jgi:DNA-directed RNA polymerase specialized sigma54-like protein
VCSAAEAVIGNLDEDGRLTATNEEIAAQGGYANEDVERGAANCDEAGAGGCGARDVRECCWRN